MMFGLGNSPMGVGFGWLFTLTWVVWFVVGVLAIMWLWQQITKK